MSNLCVSFWLCWGCPTPFSKPFVSRVEVPVSWGTRFDVQSIEVKMDSRVCWRELDQRLDRIKQANLDKTKQWEKNLWEKNEAANSMCRKSSILIHAKNSEAVSSLFGLKLLWHQRLSGLEVHDSAPGKISSTGQATPALNGRVPGGGDDDWWNWERWKNGSVLLWTRLVKLNDVAERLEAFHIFRLKVSTFNIVVVSRCF